jgi:hypothetical protein
LRFPIAEAAGIISRAVPTMISAANPKIVNRAGDLNSTLRESVIDAFSHYRKADISLSLNAGNYLMNSFCYFRQK